MEKLNREHDPLRLTKAQAKNLEKLRKYLNGELKAGFNMKIYCEKQQNGLSGSQDTNCGTVGCAVGHGPYAGIPKRKSEGWKKYEERVFGTGKTYHADKFLFGFYWYNCDNTKQGVVNRINYAIEHGVPQPTSTLSEVTNADYVTNINEELNAK